jgi:hypothetical protein
VVAAVYPRGVGSYSLTTPLCLPVMAFAPSVQISTHLDQQSLFDDTKLSTSLKISSPVVLVSSGLQKRMPSLIDSVVL